MRLETTYHLFIGRSMDHEVTRVRPDGCQAIEPAGIAMAAVISPVATQGDAPTAKVAFTVSTLPALVLRP